MSFWQKVKGWLASEASEARDVARNVESELDRELSERERRLEETPGEALDRLQAESDANLSMFDEIGDRIGGIGAKADASADLDAEPDPSSPE